MEISAQFTQFLENDTTTLRPGGILLRGRARQDRQPIHMILLVDTSGSMDLDSKLASVRRSAQVLLHLLTPEDRLSLVSFDDTTHILLRQVAVTADERQAIEYRIQSLHTDGSTNMSAGLLEARDLVEVGSARKQGLLLLTDGHANCGISTPDGILQIVGRIMTDHPSLSVTTVGYGSDHNVDLLTQIAKSGGGAYNVVNNLEDVASVFGDICGGLMSVAAQRVRVEFPPGYEVKTSYKTAKHPDGMTVVQVGDVYSDAEATILFKGAPSLGGIRVQGTDMQSLDNLDTIVEPTHTAEPTSTVFVLAQIRQDVAEILEDVRKGIKNRDRIETRIRTIRELDSLRDHPLIPMLLEDLEAALAMLNRGQAQMTQEDHTLLAQHSAYVGMSRGLRAAPSAPAAAAAAASVWGMAPSVTPVAPALASFSSPFANRLQRQTATVMRNMTSQTQDATVSQMEQVD